MSVVDSLKNELRGLWAGGDGVSLGAVAVGWGLLNGVRMVYPVLLPHLQDAYGLTLTTAGLLVTVLWLSVSVGQVPSGVLADRHDESAIMAASTVVVGTALTLVVVASSTLVLFAATALWGLGHALYPIARITFLSKLYDNRLGSALGVTMAAGDIGQTVLPPVATVLTAAVAWQLGLWFIVPVLVVVGVGLLLVPVPQSAHSASAGSLREITRVVGELRTQSMGLITLILFLYLFIWQSFTAFYPTYLTQVKGLSPSVASLLFGSFFAVGIVVKPVSGASYDRFGMKKTLAAILVPSVFGFALLPVLDGLWPLVISTSLISIMLGSGSVTHAFLADAFSAELQGTGLGVVRALTMSVAAVGPVAFGVVGDNGYFDEGYVGLAVIMCGILVLIAQMPELE